jgi:hypothetical protein
MNIWSRFPDDLNNDVFMSLQPALNPRIGGVGLKHLIISEASHWLLPYQDHASIG